MSECNRRSDLYIGLMSGTSMDAVDTVIADFAHDNPVILGYEQFEIPTELKNKVRQLDSNSPLKDVMACDVALGGLFGQSVNDILAISGIKSQKISAVGSHGQTICHNPDGQLPTTVQIGDPNVLAHRCQVTTIADFRRMDIAAGGQGAPLAPAFHDKIFRKKGVNRAILNIGGIANLTLLDSNINKAVKGFDSGPGNGLLDDWNQKHCGTAMDRDSRWASSGECSLKLLGMYLDDPYFLLPIPKSTGRDYFNLTWLEDRIAAISENLKPEDIQASLLRLSTTSIAQSVKKFAPETEEIYVCGGGVHNPTMLKQIDEQLPNIKLFSTASLGVDPDAVEALTFAWLAKERLTLKTASNPSISGATKPQILGGIYEPATRQK